jgi:hypothetical protein
MFSSNSNSNGVKFSLKSNNQSNNTNSNNNKSRGSSGLSKIFSMNKIKYFQNIFKIFSYLFLLDVNVCDF